MKKNNMRKNVHKVLAGMLFFLAAGSLSAADYTICSGGSCDYTSLGAAMNKTTGAPSGSTLILKEDISEDLSFDNYAQTYTITSDATTRTWTNVSGRNVNFTNSGGYDLTFQNMIIENTGGSEIFYMNQDGNINFENCVIKNTTGSGKLITMQNGGKFNFYRSELIGNASTPVGIEMQSGVNTNEAVHMQNTIIRDIGGKALDCNQTKTTNMMVLYNCTFAGNGTAYESNSTGVIRNCLFTDNTDDFNLTHVNADETDFEYCGFEEQTTFSGTTGNVFGLDSSVFADYSSGSLMIDCSNEDVVDTGTDMSSYYTIDKDGALRPQGDGYDMGAYECPGISVSKSANVTAAYFNDTITFCITVTNTASDSDLESYVWDTVPDNTTYIGCDNDCTYSESENMVVWFVALGPTYSKTLCFWVRITGYPFLINGSSYLAAVRKSEYNKFVSGHSATVLLEKFYNL